METEGTLRRFVHEGLLLAFAPEDGRMRAFRPDEPAPEAETAVGTPPVQAARAGIVQVGHRDHPSAAPTPGIGAEPLGGRERLHRRVVVSRGRAQWATPGGKQRAAGTAGNQ